MQTVFISYNRKQFVRDVPLYPAEVARLSILSAPSDKKWCCFEAHLS